MPGRRLSRPPPPSLCQVGALGGGFGEEREEGGGGRLAREVVVVLVGVEHQAHIEVTCLGLGAVALPRLVPRGRLLHGEEGPQGCEEARRRDRRDRQQGPVNEPLEGEAREQCPAGRVRGRTTSGTAPCKDGGASTLRTRSGRAPRSAGSSTDTGTARSTSSIYVYVRSCHRASGLAQGVAQQCARVCQGAGQAHQPPAYPGSHQVQPAGGQ